MGKERNPFGDRKEKGAGGREHSEPGNVAEIHVYPS